MDVYYILNLIDFVVRVILVSMLFMIYFKFSKMDNELLKSIAYLNFSKVRSSLNYVLVLSPLFLAASILEYPEFRFLYGEGFMHFIQDILLSLFQIAVIYFLLIVYRVSNLPRH